MTDIDWQTQPIRFKGGIRGATTKRALRDAVAADPSQVHFWSPQIFDTGYNGPLSGLPEGVVLDVSGPDPRNNPRWYATIRRDRNGKLVVR